MPLTDSDNISRPPFVVEALPRTDAVEDRFRISLTNSRTHYYIAINSTVLAVWRGEEQTPVIEVVKQLADRFNVLRGDPPVSQGNYRFTEENTRPEGAPSIATLDEVLETLPYIGGDMSQYLDEREGIYD
jgi:hypothetical protein